MPDASSKNLSLEDLPEKKAELEQTVQQAQDLAFRAIDSGSQAGTYEAVREIALEQAKGKERGAAESSS